ncbi:MAG: hypothetical protein IKU36_00585 [Bacteroidales bacterium]|nr:hypothetical protein [Bacteroidales bacterium]
MCKANTEIITKVQELMELRRMAEELQSEIDALQEAVKSFMGSEESMIAGAFKVSYEYLKQQKIFSVKPPSSSKI